MLVCRTVFLPDIFKQTVMDFGISLTGDAYIYLVIRNIETK